MEFILDKKIMSCIRDRSEFSDKYSDFSIRQYSSDVEGDRNILYFKVQLYI